MSDEPKWTQNPDGSWSCYPPHIHWSTAVVYPDEADTFPPLVAALAALRKACDDGWADGESAAAGYLAEAQAELGIGNGGKA